MLRRRITPYLVVALFFALNFSGLSSAQAFQEEPEPTPQPAELTTLIDDALKLIEAKDYAAMIERTAEPSLVEKLKAGKNWDRVVEQFASKAETLEKALLEVRGKPVALTHKGLVAGYELPKSLKTPNNHLYFQKINDRWYLCNNRPPAEAANDDDDDD